MSNFVHENKIQLLITNSGDTLVHNTNNSIVCLYKHPALRCQVSASYTAQNMVASLDTSSSLDSGSDRFTANSETCNTVAHESHNYLYSSLSYFSDISDHNSQVIQLDKYIKSQTNDVIICDQNLNINMNSEINEEGITSQLSTDDTGSELSSNINLNNENNTVQTRGVGPHGVYVNKEPLIRECGFIPEKIPKIIYTAKNHDIEFCNPSQWLRDMHEAVGTTNKPNYQRVHRVYRSQLGDNWLKNMI